MTQEEGRSRAWLFTLNNYSEDEEESIRAEPCKYLVFGHEIAETGTPHLQGYIEYSSLKTLLQMKALLPRAWWGSRKGTPAEAMAYCKKTDPNPFEKGTISRQGRRSDLDKVRASLAQGGSMREVVETASSSQSVRFAEIYLKYKEKRRDFIPQVTWLYGSTGVGKSHLALAHAKALGYSADDVYFKGGDNAKWWDGYDAHPVVIIDDIRDTFCSFVRLLALTDRYPCSVESKGGSRQLLAKHMYITAPSCPVELFPYLEEDIGQLARRLTRVQEILSFTNSITHKGDAIPQEDDSTPSPDS